MAPQYRIHANIQKVDIDDGYDNVREVVVVRHSPVVSAEGIYWISGFMFGGSIFGLFGFLVGLAVG